MIRFLYGDALNRHPVLRDTMFRDRAAQFSTRLGWAVNIDRQGLERDEYDALNPLYVIWEGRDGRHGGSLRFLPTTGRVMINDHFRHLTGGSRSRVPASGNVPGSVSLLHVLRDRRRRGFFWARRHLENISA